MSPADEDGQSTTDEEQQEEQSQEEASEEESSSSSGSEDEPSAQEKAEQEREEREKAAENIAELEDDPPVDLDDWPGGKEKYITFGGGEGDHGYHEGPEANLGPVELRRFEDGSIEIGGEPVDNPEDYKADPIPGGPTDPNAPGDSVQDGGKGEDDDEDSDDEEKDSGEEEKDSGDE